MDSVINPASKKPEIPDVILAKWQRIVDQMAKVIGVPAGLIMKVDSPQIEVFLSSVTEGNPYEKGERADLNTGLYCEMVMNTRRPLLVPDALKDPEWDHNPDIELGIIYYLGFPLEWPDGEIFGTICVLDVKDNPKATSHKELIIEFKEAVETDLLVVLQSIEREQLIERLQDQSNHLQQMVAERTAKLQKANEDLKIAYGELKKSENKFRTLFNHASDAIGIYDLDGQFMEVNQTACEILGYSRAEMLQMTPMEVDISEYAAKIPALIKEVLENDHKISETALSRKDGSTFPAELSSQLIEYAGKPAVLSIARDLTDRKKAEEALKASEKKYSTLVEKGNDGILIVQDNLIKYTNSKGAEQIGYTKEEIIGKSPFEYVAKEDRKRVLGYRTRSKIEGNIPNKFEFYAISKDGRKVPIEASYSLIEYEGRPAVMSIGRDITERKRAEEALQYSEEKFRSMFQHSAAGMAVFSSDGDILQVNPALWQFLGYSKDELLQLNAFDPIHPDDREDVRSFFEELVLGKRQFFHFEKRFVRKDSSIVWGHASAVLLHSSRNNSFCVMALVQDITDRKKAEEALRASEKKYSTLVEKGNDGITIVQDDVIKYANSKAAEITGRTKEEIVGKPSLEFVAEESREWILEKEKERLKYGRIFPNKFELYGLCKDGSKVPMESNSSLIEYEGRPAIMSISRDITERKRAEEALRLNESRLEALLELCQMTEVSIQEIMDFVREEAVRLTRSKIGYLAFLNEEETVLEIHSRSKSVMEECKVAYDPIVYPVESTGLWGEAVRQRKSIITNDYSAPNPLKKGCPEGHVKLTRHMNIPLFDGEKIVSVMGVGNKDEDYDQSDVRQLTLLMENMWRILQRKRAEEELKKYSEDLSKANEELKSLDMMKDEFLSNVGHELKTPLISIIGYNELMHDETLGSLNKQQKKAMEVVVRNSERLRRLIDSLLYLSLEKAGKIKFAFSPIHADEIIESTIVEMTPQVKEKGLNIKFDLPEDLPLIEGDRDYLKQLLANLIDNAIKFTPSGGLLTVATYADDNNLHIVIKDTGIGIAKELIPDIFKLFHQLDGSTTRRYDGTGLGMYICKSIVEKHNGNIWIESEEDVGTTVHVTFPFLNA